MRPPVRVAQAGDVRQPLPTSMFLLGIASRLLPDPIRNRERRQESDSSEIYDLLKFCQIRVDIVRIMVTNVDHIKDD